MIIHAVLPEKEKIDYEMRELSLFNTNFKYISFKESTSDMRLGALHINKMKAAQA